MNLECLLNEGPWISRKTREEIVQRAILDTFDFLRECLNSMDRDVTTVGFEQMRQANKRLFCMIEDKSDPLIRKTALELLGSNVDLLYRAMWHNPTEDEKCWAKLAASLGAKEGEAIVALLRKRKGLNRRFIGHQIPAFIGAVLLKLLGLHRILELSKDPHVLVRRAAIQALRVFHSPEDEAERLQVVGAMKKALSDESDGVALEAAMDSVESCHREETRVEALLVFARILGNTKSPAFSQASSILERTEVDIALD